MQSGYVFVHTIQLFTHTTFKTPTNCVGVLWAPGVKKSHKIPQIFKKSHPTLWVFKVPQIRVPRVGLSLVNAQFFDSLFENRTEEKLIGGNVFLHTTPPML